MSIWRDQKDPDTDEERSPNPANSASGDSGGATEYITLTSSSSSSNIYKSRSPSYPPSSEADFEVVQRYEGYPFAVFKTETPDNRAAQISALLEKGIAPLFPSEVKRLKSDYPTGTRMSEHQTRVLHTLKLVMPDANVLGAAPPLLTDEQVKERQNMVGKPLGKKKR